MNDSPNSAGLTESDQPQEVRRTGWAKLGIGLILLSGVLWFSLFAIPFLPLSGGQKAGLLGVVFALVQVCWWLGAALAGPRVVARIKSLFRRSGREKTDV